MITTVGELNPVQFIHQMLKSNQKKKLKTSQILNLLENYQPLVFIKDQMIFLTFVVNNYYQNVLAFDLKLKKFKLQIQGGVKEIREKDKQQKMGQHVRNKRRKKDSKPLKRVDNLIDLMKQQLDNPSSVESNSNPSNPDQQRINIQEGKSSGNQTSNNRDSSNKDIRNIDPAFKEGLDKISEEIGIDYHSTQYHNLNEIKPMQEESSSSSSRELGLINNLEYKMKTLLGNIQQQNIKTNKRKVNRKTNKTSTRTKKIIFDENTLFNQNALNITLPNVNESKISTDANEIEQIKFYQDFMKIISVRNQPFEQNINQIIINPQKMLSLKGLNNQLRAIKKIKKQNDNQQHINYIGQRDYSIDQYHLDIAQYNNQLNESYQKNQIKDIQFEKESKIIFQENKITLTDCARKYKRSKHSIFIEILARASEGQVQLYQNNPKKFSQITISVNMQ